MLLAQGLAECPSTPTVVLAGIAAHFPETDLALSANPNLDYPTRHLLAGRGATREIRVNLLTNSGTSIEEVLSWLRQWDAVRSPQRLALWKYALDRDDAAAVAAYAWTVTPKPWLLHLLITGAGVPRQDRVRAAAELVAARTRRSTRSRAGALARLPMVEEVSVARLLTLCREQVDDVLADCGDPALAGRLRQVAATGDASFASPTRVAPSPTRAQQVAEQVLAATDEARVLDLLARHPGKAVAVAAAAVCRPDWETAAAALVDVARAAAPNTARHIVTRLLANRWVPRPVRQQAALVLAAHPELGHDNRDLVLSLWDGPGDWEDVARVAGGEHLATDCMVCAEDLSTEAMTHLFDWVVDYGDPATWTGDWETRDASKRMRWQPYRGVLLAFLVRPLTAAQRHTVSAFAGAVLPDDKVNSQLMPWVAQVNAEAADVRVLAGALCAVGRVQEQAAGRPLGFGDIAGMPLWPLVDQKVSAFPVVRSVIGRVVLVMCERVLGELGRGDELWDVTLLRVLDALGTGSPGTVEQTTDAVITALS